MPAAAPVEIIRFASRSPERWRNGGGTTVEILRSRTTAVPGPAAGAPAAAPAGTEGPGAGKVGGGDGAGDVGAGGGPGWLYRISVADVEKEGDFSAFPGFERILTVIDGEFLLLTVDGVEQGLQKYRPFRFDGGAATRASLPTGPIRDLNVITAPGVRGHVVILELSKKRPHPVFGGQYAVLLQGQASVASPVTGAAASGAGAGEAGADGAGAGGDAGQPVVLERLDTVVGSEEMTPEISGRGFLAVVSIDEGQPN